MNPRNARSYETYQLLGMANFVGKQYSEGIRWALRAINEKPGMLQPHLTSCTVMLARTTSPKHALRSRRTKARARARQAQIGGTVVSWPIEDRKRADTFFRIAAGLEDPSAAEALR